MGQFRPDGNAGMEALLARAVAKAELGDLAGARDDLENVRSGEPRPTPAFDLRRQLAICLVAILGAEDGAAELARVASTQARRQQADLWDRYATILADLAHTSADPSSGVVELDHLGQVALVMAAEVVVERLGDFRPEALRVVADAAASRPRRWLQAIRRAASGSGSNRIPAAQILELIGER